MSELAALEAVTEAVESGAGLPEVVRAAAKALDASLAVADAWGATLAVAARSPAEERALLSQGKGVTSTPLRVGDTVVGTMHMRATTTDVQSGEPSAQMKRLLVTMIASEVERVRAPERASETAAAEFLRAILRRELTEREALAQARGRAVAGPRGRRKHDRRARPPAGADRRGLARARAGGRRAWRRAVVSRSIAALSERENAGTVGAEVLLLIPGGVQDTAARAAEAVLREMEAGLAGLHVRARAQPYRRGPGRSAARRGRGAAGGERRPGWLARRSRWRSSRPAPTGCCCAR